LLVQPNLEILAFRQGLTPDLLGRLSRFAVWKTLGSACTLELQAETVYRALETGDTFNSLLATLQRHGTKPVPASVVETLRTWSEKRERISVYPSAALFEFASAADLEEALARGLPAVRLADKLAVVADEAGIDFKHFRLTGTRDFGLPPERCVDVGADGVTLTVDLARSDLLLETELHRFAEPVDRAAANGRRTYRITPATLAAGRQGGLTAQGLDTWFRQRTGAPLSPATLLLLQGGQTPAPELRRLLVLHLASAAIADGLEQWPGTRPLVHQRLGPTALVVEEANVGALRERLAGLGISLHCEGADP
jgi:hypothetical protein